MELLITIAAVILLIAALLIAKEVITKAESSPQKGEDIHEKFQRLNKMAAQMKI